MSNNIYDILKKMQNLEAPKQSLNESKKSKPDFLDMDKDGDKTEPMKKAAREKSKGAVAEAVAHVEQQLAEKYQGFKQLDEETQQWQSVKQGAKDVADVAQGLAAIATGGKIRSIDQQMAAAERAKQAAVDRTAAEKGYEVGTKYHNQLIKTNPAYREEFMSLAKDAPMGQLRNIQNRLQLKYDPMGGPVDESALQAHIGMKKYGPEGMEALQQAGRDGASKEKMAKIRAQHDKMDEDNSDELEQDPYGQWRKKIKPGNTVGSKIVAGAKNMKRKAEKFVANTMGHNLLRGPLDEQNYTEDMLSPGQKKIASMAGDPDKIDAKDFAALRGQKKGVKKEGNRFTAGLANDDVKVGEKIPGTNAVKTKDIEEGRTSMREGWEEMQKYLEKKRGPESKGDAGKKAGTRYGGSAQRDNDEETDGEGQPAVKKKGRPKGTGGGAKFNFKKPKD
jgi:hypothetical protein